MYFKMDGRFFKTDLSRTISLFSHSSICLFWSAGCTEVRNFSSSLKIQFKSFTVLRQILLINDALATTGSRFLISVRIAAANDRLQSLKLT